MQRKKNPENVGHNSSEIGNVGKNSRNSHDNGHNELFLPCSRCSIADSFKFGHGTGGNERKTRVHFGFRSIHTIFIQFQVGFVSSTVAGTLLNWTEMNLGRADLMSMTKSKKFTWTCVSLINHILIRIDFVNWISSGPMRRSWAVLTYLWRNIPLVLLVNLDNWI